MIGAIYIGHAGERWRVHDCDYRDRKFMPVALESPRAKYRVFVSLERLSTASFRR